MRDSGSVIPDHIDGAAVRAHAALDRRALLWGVLAASMSACSSPRHLIGVTPEDSVNGGAPPARTHRIFIATTRALSSEPGEFFSGDRSLTLNYASVDVRVPPGHVIGQAERPRRLPPDPEKHFIFEDPKTYDLVGFQAAAEVALRPVPRRDRKLLIWVHGYNSTLTDAALRLAQFVEDTGYDGIPLLFSWASAGKLTSYVYDINSALMARDAINWLGAALARSSFESIDVVAHSMGNFLVLEAIRGAANANLFDTSGKLKTVVLADPDIDYELFVTQVAALPPEKRRFYVLVSNDDRALALSSFLSRRPRVGNIDPEALTKLGVNVIDLSLVKDTSSSNHSKFVDAPEIVQLIGDRIVAGDNRTSSANSGVGEALIIGAGGVLGVLD
ncbi:MAG: alpha/beta hydrolase [Rhodobacteraceae bacterium]|nr:alpha/beta hydrolase [Paracoccaceae bacterium]